MKNQKEMPIEEIIRKRVEKKMKERAELVIHGVAFVVVNTMLFLIWLFTSIGDGTFNFPWFLIPLMGWGIGMFAHYWEYHTEYGAGREKREELIAREIERERARIYDSGKIR